MLLVIVVDANILISALLGGKPHRLLFDSRCHFITTERTTWEVKRYLPFLSRRLGLAELELLLVLESFPITAYQERYYAHKLPQARELIVTRDRKDVDILALALVTGAPLWSQDRDFEHIQEIIWVTTEEMLE
ncbi:MAG: PIN domain-containing protein [Candidatus Poribacteria bacterium]